MLKKLAKQTLAKLSPNSYKTLNWIEINKDKTLHNIEIAKTFSGLDTLPSLAAVLIALSLILEDFVLYIIGLIIGFIGMGTIFVLGDAIYKTFKLL
jgi:hypothetical protein